jgi:hypothetical protein
VLGGLFGGFLDLVIGLSTLGRDASLSSEARCALVLTAISEPFFFSFTSLSEIVDTLDDVTDSLLLLSELSLDTVEVAHQFIELLILGLFLLLVVNRVEQSELLLELFLSARLVFLASVEGDEVTELGLLLALSNVNDDSHHHILKSILTSGLTQVYDSDVLTDFHDVV